MGNLGERPARRRGITSIVTDDRGGARGVPPPAGCPPRESAAATRKKLASSRQLRSNRSRRHRRAIAPGPSPREESPAMIIGKLWRSVKAQMNKVANFLWKADPIAQLQYEYDNLVDQLKEG